MLESLLTFTDADTAAYPPAVPPPTRRPGTPVRLAGWGNYPVAEAYEVFGENLEAITADVVLTRGLGRSYGDASLPPPEDGAVANATLADCLLAFDAETGVVRSEAGMPLWRLNRIFLPRRWFTPVTPGTHFVTLGGMVAADVHGKSHRSAGSFGDHVRRLKMRTAEGRILECSDDENADLFRATIGGMGLTGHILEVEFQLQRIPSPWIWQESERVADFETLLARLEDAAHQWPFTACWVDLVGRGARLGRGILFKGRWAEASEAPPGAPRWQRSVGVPFQLPNWTLQRWMVEAFNLLNYWKQGPRTRAGIVHPETCFYPLDVVQDWNRAYGKRGFTQYQCVLPGATDDPQHREFLEILRRNNADVFLAVIKDLGSEGRGMISFPCPGVSYNLDLPVSGRTQAVVDALNEHVITAGGRIYLAKDAFTRAEHFRAMEPRLDAWNAVRRKWDPQRKLKSALSVRLLGDEP
jgi:FAD/FMN-containing dehydrogenase